MKKIYFLYLDQQKELEQQLTFKKVQFKSHDRWDHLLEDYIGQILGIKDKQERFDEVDRLSIHRLDTRLNRYSFTSKIYDELINENSDIEFPGILVRNDYDDPFTTSASDLFSDDTCIILINPIRKPTWELTAVQYGLNHPLSEGGICDYCREANEGCTLNFQCECSEVFYCSLKCKIQDMGFHSRTCLKAKYLKNVLYLEDFEVEKWSAKANLKIGLQNIGNTCYMASLLQAIKLIPPLRNHILQLKNEELQPLIDQEKPHQTNVLPYIADFMRNVCFSKEESFFPWLIKAAIGVNNSEVNFTESILTFQFLRFNQADAQEFFQSLSELVEKEVQFWKYKNFLQEMMEGKVTNYSKCLECEAVSSRIESWTILSLPIPEQTIYGQIYSTFVPYDLKK